MRSAATAYFGLIAGLASVASAAGQPRLSTIYSFTGAYPGGLVPAGGVLRGVTSGSDHCGAFFELQPPSIGGGPWEETALYAFGSISKGACNPYTTPIAGPNGAVYGIATGGAYGYGVLYGLQPAALPGGPWTETDVYSFGNPDSGVGLPGGTTLIAGPGGSLYLVTDGGTYGSGALVQFQPPPTPGGAWTPVVLYSFYASATGTPDWLVMGPNGVLYATSGIGGAFGRGTVLQLTPPSTPGGAWTNTVLYNFSEGEGNAPNSLTLAPNGTLYGTTYGSGYDEYGDAVAFELAPASPGGSWTFTEPMDFGAREMTSPLTLFKGNLYGSVYAGPGSQVFELQLPSTPGGSWTTIYLHDFTNGQYSTGPLVIDQGGTLYGTTAAVLGQPASGTVYSIAPN